MNTSASGRDSRLNMRIGTDALEIIREAASSQQQDVTSFVLGAAMERARSVLVEERILRLTHAEFAQVNTALDAEPQPIPELAALVREMKGRRLSTKASVQA
ncbi:Uncharacterized conserved protein, DUF1778 family [Sanguibacter gelidistatuariae]|uniref:Uncharacterized conserved protein, DUF1778 family n=1 Tax=Sanguibacter gelidistatuariae TaxID=1814289 RepID=A0A1G6Y2K9_9MICO|nr:DUF1778 domain-containing protein [Sanguibacter gelidistatuariae]SDD83957.1 Uncharacterized conserved protein, DUF1778 family [Sanguibacter gelidistatuariae]